MSKSKPDWSLANPHSPLRSARSLLKTSDLSPSLQEASLKPLSRWLSQQSDCLQLALIEGTGDETPVDLGFRYRLATTTARQVRRSHLRYLRLAEGHAEAHSDASVRKAAAKLIRGLETRRVTWDQVTDHLKEVRSLVFKAGKRRNHRVDVYPSQTIEVRDGVEWRLVTSVARLQALRNDGAFCTGRSPMAMHYARELKERQLRFYELVDAEQGVQGLVSMNDVNAIVEARSWTGGLLWTKIDDVRALLAATSASVGSCSDLIHIGLADGFEAVDFDRPDLTLGQIELWKGRGESILVRFTGRFYVLDATDGEFRSRCGSNADAASMFGCVAHHLMQNK